MKTNEIIKFLREKNNLTQEELAQKLGLKKAAINKYESGSVENIKKTVVQEMAKIFDVSPCYIMFGDSETENKTTKEEITLTDTEQILVNDYRLLNTDGQKEANKRVKELTAIPFYRTNETVTIAAHSDKPIDNDEMDKIHKDLEDMMKW